MDKQDFLIESKEKIEFYRREIQRMIEETDDTHALCCTYTTILTHLRILKGDTAC